MVIVLEHDRLVGSAHHDDRFDILAFFFVVHLDFCLVEIDVDFYGFAELGPVYFLGL